MAKILLADADRALCWMWSETLRDLGHVVHVVHDGEAAADALEGGMFDLMICDVIMPISGAIVLAGLARLRQPAMRIIAVSALPPDRYYPLVRDIQAADVTLGKPCDLDRLCEAVDVLLDRREAA